MAENRFTDMLKNVAEPPSPKTKRKPIDFGASVERDDKVVSTFQRLHAAPALEKTNELTQPPPLKHEANNAPTTADRLTVKLSDGLTVKASDSRTVKPSDGQTAPKYDTPHIRPSPVPAPEYQTIPHTIPFDVLNLSYNQASILEFLISKTNGLTNYKEIHDTTNITMPSARDALSRLVTRGFLARPQTYRSAAYQGMSFVLNKALCDIFISAGGLIRDRYQTMHQTVRLSDHQTVRPSDGQTHFSSSFNKATSTITSQTVAQSDGLTIIQSDMPDSRPSDKFVLIGPEMAYWVDAGLQERQTLAWCKEFDLDPDHLRQQLAWSRWDLVENNKEETVQNVINWIYGVLRRTGGCYPRPDNYLSLAERRLRDMEVEAKRLEEAMQNMHQTELNLEFQRIMNETNGDEYQQLYAQLTDFEKQSKGKVLEMGLRRVFQSSKEQPDGP